MQSTRQKLKESWKTFFLGQGEKVYIIHTVDLISPVTFMRESRTSFPGKLFHTLMLVFAPFKMPEAYSGVLEGEGMTEEVAAVRKV